MWTRGILGSVAILVAVVGWLGLGVTLIALSASRALPQRAPTDPAVVVTADKKSVQWLDFVRFTARIRPDLARTMKNVDHPGDPALLEPHIIGWHWVPDIDLIDPWTTACDTRELSCAIQVHGSGTMVFSIRARNQVCADWVHIDAGSVPDIDETDSTARVRGDSISAAVATKAPTWRRCTA